MTKTPESHVFTILFKIAGVADDGGYAERAYDDDDLQDLLLGVPQGSDGIFVGDFERTAPSLETAVLTAIGDLQRVFPEAEVLRVDPDNLTTIAGIARRMNRSHESIRLITKGERGPGGFPMPAGTLDGKTQVWRWHEVVDWFRNAMGIDVPEHRHAAFLAMINDILELRRIAPAAIDNRKTASALAALLPTVLTA